MTRTFLDDLRDDLVRAGRELSATPTPDGATVAAPRRARSRRAILATTAVAAGAIVAAIVLAGGRGAPGPSIAEAALAKLTPAKGVLVLGLDTRQRFGSRTAHMHTTEWVTAHTARRVVVALDPRTGRIIASTDMVTSDRGVQSYETAKNTITTFRACPGVRAPRINSLSDPVASLLAQLTRHALRAKGTATFDGRRVHRLVSTLRLIPRRSGTGRAPMPKPLFEVLVDATTSEPVASINRPFDGSAGGQGLLITRFTSRTVLPRTATNLALLRLPPHPTAHRVTAYLGPCAAKHHQP